MKIFFGVVLLYLLHIFEQTESTCNPCEGSDVCREENYLCYSKDGKTAQCLNPCKKKQKYCPYKCRTDYGTCGNYTCKPIAVCYTPCDYTRCPGEAPCFFNATSKETSCINPCIFTLCEVNTTCVAVPGKCGTSLCEPQALCIPFSPPPQNPPSSCDGVTCPSNQKCSVVKTLQYEKVAICGEDPCIQQQQKCCNVRYSNGQRCNNVTCYLNFKKGSCIPGKGCQVEPECLDPCKVGKIDCSGKQGQFCYPQEVQCIRAPCPPIPTCREPCAPKANVCLPSQTCNTIDFKCIGDKTNKNYDPYCKPEEICI